MVPALLHEPCTEFLLVQQKVAPQSRMDSAIGTCVAVLWQFCLDDLLCEHVLQQSDKLVLR
jgi:hypothetical protein